MPTLDTYVLDISSLIPPKAAPAVRRQPGKAYRPFGSDDGSQKPEKIVTGKPGL